MLHVVVSDAKQGITNAHKLLSLKRQLQADHVRHYLAGMRSDQMHEMHIIKQDVTDPAEIRKVAKYNAISQVVDERAINGRMLLRDQAVAEHRGYSDVHRLKGQR
jgi:hypothetical protein